MPRLGSEPKTKGARGRRRKRLKGWDWRSHGILHVLLYFLKGYKNDRAWHCAGSISFFPSDLRLYPEAREVRAWGQASFGFRQSFKGTCVWCECVVRVEWALPADAGSPEQSLGNRREGGREGRRVCEWVIEGGSKREQSNSRGWGGSQKGEGKEQEKEEAPHVDSASAVLGFIPDWPEVYHCPRVCVSLQMANIVTSVCYMVLAAVVVVYAQQSSQQGKTSSSIAVSTSSTVLSSPISVLFSYMPRGWVWTALQLLRYWLLKI